MAAIQEVVDEVYEIYATLRTHKRYQLRLAAIISILIGSVLNFASFMCAFIGFHRRAAPRYLTVWASIVVSDPAQRLHDDQCFDIALQLGISFLWNVVDLASHSDRIFHRKQFMTLNALLFMDTLGFLSYLTLLIANGIIISDLYHGPTVLFAYNSVPWMVCW